MFFQKNSFLESFKNKYESTISLLLVFEKTKYVAYNTTANIASHSTLLISNQWFYAINCFFKNETFNSLNYLVEATTIDTKAYSNLDNLLFLAKYRYIHMYTYYFLTTKARVTLLLWNNTKQLPSIDNLYPNANWLERELGEMYGINFFKKNDNRKLLLDYTKIEAPFLKDFPVEGYTDAFYNILTEQVTFYTNETIEL